MPDGKEEAVESGDITVAQAPSKSRKTRRTKDSAKKSSPSEQHTVEGHSVKSADGTSKVADLPMTAARTLPLLICSVGNPGSTYANTLHSAGHTVVNRLADHLDYSRFTKDRQLGNGLVSKPPVTGGSGDWTFWQSTSYMNESGKGVRAAFLAWTKVVPDGEGKLIVIHDELEKPLGAVTVRTAQGASAKGHNGIKSIMSVIGNTNFARIGIGIGRPVSRDSNVVARYVLKKMTPADKLKIDACVEEVVAKLRQLEKG